MEVITVILLYIVIGFIVGIVYGAVFYDEEMCFISPGLAAILWAVFLPVFLIAVFIAWFDMLVEEMRPSKKF